MMYETRNDGPVNVFCPFARCMLVDCGAAAAASNVPSTELKSYEGKTITLHFSGGHIVRAKLLHVDGTDRDEVIYDVLETLLRISAGHDRDDTRQDLAALVANAVARGVIEGEDEYRAVLRGLDELEQNTEGHEEARRLSRLIRTFS